MLGFMANEGDNLYEDFYKTSERGSLQEPVTVLAPFMGGGTTIFEALRFGCKVIGNDLQPLSLLVTKALVEPVDGDAVNKAVKTLEKTVGRRTSLRLSAQSAENFIRRNLNMVNLNATVDGFFILRKTAILKTEYLSVLSAMSRRFCLSMELSRVILFLRIS